MGLPGSGPPGCMFGSPSLLVQSVFLAHSNFLANPVVCLANPVFCVWPTRFFLVQLNFALTHSVLKCNVAFFPWLHDYFRMHDGIVLKIFKRRPEISLISWPTGPISFFSPLKFFGQPSCVFGQPSFLCLAHPVFSGPTKFCIDSLSFEV